MTNNIGTTAFIAPEVLFGSEDENTSTPAQSTKNKVRHATKVDVYSFSIIMWILLFNNNSPYGNLNDVQIMAKLFKNLNTRPVVEESKVGPEMSWFVALMKQCWASNPLERPSFELICKTLLIEIENLSEM